MYGQWNDGRRIKAEGIGAFKAAFMGFQAVGRATPCIEAVTVAAVAVYDANAGEWGREGRGWRLVCCWQCISICLLLSSSFFMPFFFLFLWMEQHGERYSVGGGVIKEKEKMGEERGGGGGTWEVLILKICCVFCGGSCKN